LFNPHINFPSQSPHQLLRLLLLLVIIIIIIVIVIVTIITIILVVVVVVVVVYIIYIINLPMVRPRSCRVIYYFDTPALGRRHQSFGRVKFLAPLLGR